MKRTVDVSAPGASLTDAFDQAAKSWNQLPPVTLGLEIEIRSESLQVDHWEPAVVFYIIGSPQAPHDLELASIVAVLESGREVELSLTGDYGIEWRLRSIEVKQEKG